MPKLPSGPKWNIRGTTPEIRQAFTAGAVRLGMTQAQFLAYLLTKHASDIIKPPQEVSK